jgi:ribosome-associated protein
MGESNEKIIIPDSELIFKFSRSSGPGGQNVNKVSSKVTVLFDAANSKSFSDVQKQQILNRLSGRTDKNGVIRITSQKCRTQRANRNAAVERLKELLKDALKEKPLRKKTAMPGHIRQKRLKEKKKRSVLKKQRAGRDLREDSAGWN